MQLRSTALKAARKVLVLGHGLNASAKAHDVDAGQLSLLCKRIRTATICDHCGSYLR